MQTSYLSLFFCILAHAGYQFIYSGNRTAVYGLSCNYCYSGSHGFLQATNVSLCFCLFVNCGCVTLTMLLSIVSSFALIYRNNEEEKAFYSFLNLSRFPQALPEIYSLVHKWLKKSLACLILVYLYTYLA